MELEQSSVYVMTYKEGYKINGLIHNLLAPSSQFLFSLTHSFGVLDYIHSFLSISNKTRGVSVLLTTHCGRFSASEVKYSE